MSNERDDSPSSFSSWGILISSLLFLCDLSLGGEMGGRLLIFRAANGPEEFSSETYKGISPIFLINGYLSYVPSNLSAYSSFSSCGGSKSSSVPMTLLSWISSSPGELSCTIYPLSSCSSSSEGIYFTVILMSFPEISSCTFFMD